MAIKAPGLLIAPVLDWRAARINDPIERLRFLRAATTRASQPLIDVGRLKSIQKKGVVSVLLWACVLIPLPIPSTVRSSVNMRTMPPALQDQNQPARVWTIDDKPTFETYSNGLRIEKEFVTANRARGPYAVFPTKRLDAKPEMRTQPVGIVFHSTESHQAPFEQAETRNLRRLGRGLLGYVRQIHAYHYVIDRFGQVYRVVQESDVAFHAGASIWGDGQLSYVGLNSGFIAVAFEAQTDSETPLSAAQIHAGRVLTEMLRAKYQIASYDCVTHAQVSVNPQNGKIGYHTDWATGFPWAAIGLPDNYKLPLASVYAFGFEDDDSLLSAAGGRRWQGLAASLELVRQQAMTAGLPAEEYRRRLQRRFQDVSNSAILTRERGEEQ